MTSNSVDDTTGTPKKDISRGYTVTELTIGFAKQPPLFYADKPKQPCYRSGVWQHMSFVYAASGSAIPNWFRCDIDNCKQPFELCELKNGNKKLRKHIEEHNLGDWPIQITKNQLVDALAAATSIGKQCGELSSKKMQTFFSLDNSVWSEQFMTHVLGKVRELKLTDDSNNDDKSHSK